MNIHEYQAKELLDKYGVATPKGHVAFSPDEAEQVANKIGGNHLVVKAQVHAGGRGKGRFKNGFQGGVHLCSTPAEAKELAGKMIGQVLVTHQTGEAGRLVKKVMVAESKEIKRELYFAVTMDRATGCPMVIASREGGMDIEEVSKNKPEAILREPIHPALGFRGFQGLKLAKYLGFGSEQMQAPAKLFKAVYDLFIGCDCSLVEINPLVETVDGQVMALDAKLNFDDNALFRHPDVVEMRDEDEEDPREVEASKFNLNYIGLDGNIACMVNGAGLAMATMDIIKYYGGEPANFLDVGGSANEEQVTGAFKILVRDPKVKAILVNIFGGIMKCDVIAQGVINALKTLGKEGGRVVPLVVRLEGTNVEEGKKLLKESGLAIIAAENLADGAKKAVEATKEN